MLHMHTHTYSFLFALCLSLSLFFFLLSNLDFCEIANAHWAFLWDEFLSRDVLKSLGQVGLVVMAKYHNAVDVLSRRCHP